MIFFTLKHVLVKNKWKYAINDRSPVSTLKFNCVVACVWNDEAETVVIMVKRVGPHELLLLKQEMPLNHPNKESGEWWGVTVLYLPIATLTYPT